MADFGDTSSYPKATMPVSPLDTVKNLGAIQQQKLGIDQAKLDQANQALGYMVRAMGSLGPNARKEDYAKAAQNAVDQGLVPQQQENVFLNYLHAAPDSQSFYKRFMTSAMEGQKQIEMHTGQNVTTNDNATEFHGKRDIVSGAVRPVTQMAIQPGPTQPTVDSRRSLPTGQPNPDYLQPGIVGAAGPSGIVPSPRPRPAGLPVEPLPAPVSANPSPSFDQRYDASFPNKIVTGAAPGVSQAIQAVGEQSGKEYASMLARTKSYQSDLYPMNRVLEILKEEGPTAFGQGTDGLNTVKNAIVTWLPNVDQKTIDSVSNVEQAKKYLVQAARSSTVGVNSDQLAAAFEANPNTKMTGATIENVLKSNIALRKMEQGLTVLALQSNIPDDKISKWVAKNQNQFDPRAFGVDNMNDKAREKLMDSLKKDPKAYQKFEKTLQFAHDAELVGQ